MPPTVGVQLINKLLTKLFANCIQCLGPKEPQHESHSILIRIPAKTPFIRFESENSELRRPKAYQWAAINREVLKQTKF